MANNDRLQEITDLLAVIILDSMKKEETFAETADSEDIDEAA
ncbi:hypothetical protein [Phascolarctobacterium sp. ET69]|nr:hypothetical protein [Phascolarctobacterium sp. ET69]